MTEETLEPVPQQPAGFWERFLAFVVDAVLVRFLALFVFLAAMRGGFAPGPAPLALLLLAAFVAYHAAWKGASPGARLLGLRAVGPAGEPLSPEQGVKRALGWALYDRRAGTRVVRMKPRSGLGTAAVYGACAAIVLANAFMLAYSRLAAPELEKAAFTASAQRTLAALGTLEDAYKAGTGEYTDDISLVAGMAEHPGVILEALPKVFEKGKVKIVLSGGGYTISARALDPGKTEVSFQGPKSARR